MSVQVEGHVARGYELVAEEFERNFGKRGELGAAFAVYREGVPIIDLWGGVADRTTERRWAKDTLQPIFSGTKGLVAVCILMLIERGELDLDMPVTAYWPEFGVQGKEKILVRHVVSHTAGMQSFREPVEFDDIVDHDRLVQLLAAQSAVFEPGTLAYHAFTYGWLCGELVRRVDGRSIGRFFSEEVARPLGLELWISLPQELEGRVAILELAPNWASAPIWTFARENPNSLAAMRMLNPPLLEGRAFPWNTRAYHAAEIPAAGAIGDARSVARLYGCLAQGGQLDGQRVLDESTVALGRSELSRGHDAINGSAMAHGVGFQLQTELHSFGPPDDAFGHGGAGGSIHGAWPGEKVGFSYAMNRMRDDLEREPRAQALLTALHDCVQAGDQP